MVFQCPKNGDKVMSENKNKIHKKLLAIATTAIVAGTAKAVEIISGKIFSHTIQKLDKLLDDKKE